MKQLMERARGTGGREMSRTAPLLPALAELQARPQWVCWRKEIRNGKPTKVPYNALTGRLAESNNPATWAELAQVEARLHQQPRAYDGIGYMFHRDLTGVD